MRVVGVVRALFPDPFPGVAVMMKARGVATPLQRVVSLHRLSRKH